MHWCILTALLYMMALQCNAMLYHCIFLWCIMLYHALLGCILVYHDGSKSGSKCMTSEMRCMVNYMWQIMFPNARNTSMVDWWYVIQDTAYRIQSIIYDNQCMIYYIRPNWYKMHDTHNMADPTMTQWWPNDDPPMTMVTPWWPTNGKLLVHAI